MGRFGRVLTWVGSEVESVLNVEEEISHNNTVQDATDTEVLKGPWTSNTRPYELQWMTALTESSQGRPRINLLEPRWVEFNSKRKEFSSFLMRPKPAEPIHASVIKPPTPGVPSNEEQVIGFFLSVKMRPFDLAKVESMKSPFEPVSMRAWTVIDPKVVWRVTGILNLVLFVGLPEIRNVEISRVGCVRSGGSTG